MTSHYTNQASFIVLSHNNFILVLCLFQISKVTRDKLICLPRKSRNGEEETCLESRRTQGCEGWTR